MVWKILGGIAGLVFVLVVIVLIAAAMQPDGYKVTRSAKIKAPPAVVFAQVNNFHKWQAWSPWAKLDPAAKLTIDGAEEGVGAKYAWSGNDNMGEGKMEIIESKPATKIAIRLEFIRPMASVCPTEFAFQPEGDETVVTWTMSGKTEGLVNKAFCMFMDLDGMIGKDFDAGLAKIKEVAEKEAQAPAPMQSADPTTVPPPGENPPASDK